MVWLPIRLRTVAAPTGLHKALIPNIALIDVHAIFPAQAAKFVLKRLLFVMFLLSGDVLVEPCIYVYFTAIVGGSVLLTLIIPVPEKKSSSVPAQ